MFDRQVAETVLLIKVDGGGALVVAFQEQTETARAASLGDAGLDEAATDAVPLRLGRDGELHQLVIVLRILAAHHGKRAHGLATQQSNEDVAALLDDILNGMVELVVVGLLHHAEEVAYPLLVQLAESLVVLCVVEGHDFTSEASRRSLISDTRMSSDFSASSRSQS